MLQRQNPPQQEQIECKCGCGTLINKYLFNSHFKGGFYICRYFKGHDKKGKSNKWKIKDKVNIRAYRVRARKLYKKYNPELICLVNNNICTKKLDIHHIDKNPCNNKITNLMCLCRRHHKLADSRTSQLDNLKNISIYVNKNKVLRIRKKEPFKKFIGKCKICKNQILISKKSKLYCGVNCRQSAYRLRKYEFGVLK